MRMRTTLVALAALATLAALAIAGPSAAATRTWVVNAGVQSSVGNAKHGLQAVDYLPREIWIDAGDSVLWKVKTGEPHTVTFLPKGERPQPFDPTNPKLTQRQGGTTYAGAGYFNSGVMPAAAIGGPKNAPTTYELTFSKPGDYRYFCLLHGEMVGMVHVLPAGTPLPFTQGQYNAAGARQAAALVAQGKLLERVAQAAARSQARLVIAGTGSGRIEDQDYFPSHLTVHAGQSVTFVNLDPEAPHTVTFGPEPKQPGATTRPYGNARAYTGGPLNSGYFGAAPFPSSTWTVRFAKAGVYHFYCVLHDDNGMKGTVVVKP